jgi:hypothetical protein
MRYAKAWLVVAMCAGCNTGPERPAGFTPPPPEAGELEYDSPLIRNIASGTDVTYCSYLDAHVADETDIVHFRVLQSPTGHHAILFAARQQRPVDTHECTEDDMTNTRFLAAGGAESIGTLEIPDGLAFRIPANTQLMIQTHWINATPKPVDGQAVAYITVQPSSQTRQVMDLFNVVATNIKIPAGQTATVSTACNIKKNLQLYTLTGHEHEFGSHVDVELNDANGGSSMLWSYDWQPSFQSAPPYTIYGATTPLLLNSGQNMKVTCSWDNTMGATDLRFPREMCVASGFYFPAVDGEIDCIDGQWGG